MKTTNISIILCFIISFFLIPTVFALTANSSNYSVSMFGTGLATADPSSVSYNSTALLEAQGTTRYAESDSYIGNVGFYNGTAPYRTVIINSYSVSPSSAYLGSTITLYISTTNAQATWASVKRPDSTTERVSLNNNGNTYYVPPLVGAYSVVLYANSSTGGLASALDSFQIISTPPSTTSTLTGGGGSATVCDYVWECSSWSICSSNGQQTRTCAVSSGTCVGIKSKPEESRNCSEFLFDVNLNVSQLEITEKDKLTFNVDLIQTKNIEKIDVQIKYSILDKDKNEVFSQIETKAIEQNISYRKILEDIKINPGDYILKIEILYGALQKASAEQTFTVKGAEKITAEEEKMLKPETQNRLLVYLIILAIIIIIILTFVITRALRKNDEINLLIEEGRKNISEGDFLSARKNYGILRNLYESKYKGDPSKLKKIVDYYNSIISSINKRGLLVFGILAIGLVVFLIGFNNLTGMTIGNSIFQHKSGSIVLILLFVILISAFLVRKRRLKSLTAS